MTAATNRTALSPVQESMKNTYCWSTRCKKCNATQDTQVPPCSTCLIILDSQIDEILLIHPLSCECSCTALPYKINLGRYLVDYRHSPNQSSHTNHSHGMGIWHGHMAWPSQVQGTIEARLITRNRRNTHRHVASHSWVKLIKQRLPIKTCSNTLSTNFAMHSLEEHVLASVSCYRPWSLQQRAPKRQRAAHATPAPCFGSWWHSPSAALAAAAPSSYVPKERNHELIVTSSIWLRENDDACV